MPTPTTPLVSAQPRTTSVTSFEAHVVPVNSSTVKKKQYTNLPPPLVTPEAKVWAGKNDPPFDANSHSDWRTLNQLCELGSVASIADRFAFSKSLDVPIDPYNNTALHLAVFRKDYYLTYLLLLKGADPNLMNLSGVRPLDLAIFFQLKELESLLLAMGAQNITCAALYASFLPATTLTLSFSFPTLLTKPLRIRPKDTDPLPRRLQEHDFPLPTWPYEGPADARLFIYTALGCEQRVMQLVDAHPEVIQSIDARGATCLIQAAKFGQLAVLKALLTRAPEALALQKDREQLTVLAWACLQGHRKMVAFLLEHPHIAEPARASFMQPVSATCPLLLAAYQGDEQICQLLVTKGIVPTPIHLMMACWMQRCNVAQYFLSLKVIMIPQPFAIWLKKGFQMYYWFLQGYTCPHSTPPSLEDGLLSASPNLDPINEIEKYIAIASPEMDIIGQETVKSVPTKAAKQSALSQEDAKTTLPLIQVHYGSTRSHLTRHTPDENADLNLKTVPDTFHPSLRFIQSQKIFPFATELDMQLNSMDVQWLQLFRAMGKNEKTNYSVIAFKISTCVEALCTQVTMQPIFFSYVQGPLKEMAQAILEKVVPVFIKKTQITSGILPPPEAMENMLLAAHTVRNSVRNTAALAHMTGCWPIGQLLNAEESIGGMASKGGTTRFDVYIKENRLKQFDKLPISSPVQQLELAQFLAMPLTLYANATATFHQTLVDCHTDAGADRLLLNEQAQLVTQAMDQLLQSLQPRLGVIQWTTAQRATIAGYKAKLSEFLVTLPRKTAQLLGKWPPKQAYPQVHALLLETSTTLRQFIHFLEPLCLAAARVSEKEKRVRALQSSKIHELMKLWGESPSQADPIQRNVSTDEIQKYWFMKETWDGLVFHKENEVRGGSLDSLVKWLTHFQVDDPVLLNVFLMTHHSFTTSTHLMGLLTKRYDITPPPGLEDEKMFSAFVEHNMLPIKQRVLDAIVYWMSHFFADFLSDEKAIIVQLKDFLSNTVMKEAPGRVKNVSEKLNEQMKQVERNADPNTSAIYRPVFPKQIYSKVIPKLANDMHIFFEIDPIELARQLALVESECFRQISNKEWINQIWGRTSEASKTKAPNIQAMINITNGLSKKLAYLILSTEKLSQRLQFIKHCVLFAQQCYELKNLNGLTGIFGGLVMGPVRRLSKTWKEFEKKYPKQQVLFDKLSDLVTPKRQYANYRQFMKSATPPCIPYLGVHITDLTFIEDGNADFLPDGVSINIEKRRKVAAVIEDIVIWQEKAFYHFQPCSEIQDFFKEVPPLQTDQELYNISLVLEPIEDDDDDD